MQSVRVKLGQNGRLVIPAEYRRLMGVKAGDDIVLVLENSSLRLMTVQAAVVHAQQVFSTLQGKAKHASVVGFIAGRRAEAKREDG